MNYLKSLTVFKIIKNSIPVIINKREPIHLGRWYYGNEELKTLYANMDHCGDHICGNPQILKYTYPKYFSNSESKMMIHKTSNPN